MKTMKLDHHALNLIADDDGSVDLFRENVAFTEDAIIQGNLDLEEAVVQKFPEKLIVKRSVNLFKATVSNLPQDFYVGGYLELGFAKKLKKLPDNIKVCNSVMLRGTKIKELPERFVVNGSLDLSLTKIKYLPRGMVVQGFLDLRRSKVRELPIDLVVGGNIYIDGKRIKSIPPTIRVGGRIFSNVPDQLIDQSTKMQNGYVGESYLFWDNQLFLYSGKRKIGGNTFYYGSHSNITLVYDGTKYRAKETVPGKAGIFDFMKKESEGASNAGSEKAKE